MTAATRLECLHDGRAECWLCSDARPWWREARAKAGLSEEPPNIWARIAEQEQAYHDLIERAIREQWPIVFDRDRETALSAAGVGRL